MTQQRVPINRHTLDRFISSVKSFVTSADGGTKAKWLFVLLILFMFGINGLNVINSYVGRDFMTAIENRNNAEFLRQALLYLGVFAASTIVAVFYRYFEELLGLHWREWVTKRCILGYANHRVYYRLKKKGEIGNPDQRIADDIRTYTSTTLSFMLMLLNGTFTVIAFSGVLWSISPTLFIVAVVYAAAGTYLTFTFGRPLVRLNYDQLDREANFRSSLTYLRSNAESVAQCRREGHLIQLNMKNLADLVANTRRIIARNRIVNYYTTGYNWLIQLIPAFIVAPLFIQGKVQFGVITQSAIAFTQLLGAFSLIVTQFQSISSYTAVLARLVALIEAGEKEKDAETSGLVFSRDSSQVAYTGLTLRSPRSDRVLIKDLTLAIPRGMRVLVRGHDETARAALFHATAGLWEVGDGHIIRPGLEQIMFIGELPYLPPGTIRELLMKPWPEADNAGEQTVQECDVPEDQLLATLRLFKIETLLKGFGGLDTRQHWENVIPLAEQKRLVFARLIVSGCTFAFLDRPGTTLPHEEVDRILELLRERSISYVTFEEKNGNGNLKNYDAVLELGNNGEWVFTPVNEEQITSEGPSAAG